MKIRRGKYEETLHLKAQAEKERVSMANPEGAVWWVAEQEGGAIVGFVCAVRKTGSASVRFKSDFVLPEYRGVGLYTLLSRVRWNHYLNSRGIKKITAFCTEKSIEMYQKYGFKPQKRNEHGITFMVREL